MIVATVRINCRCFQANMTVLLASSIAMLKYGNRCRTSLVHKHRMRLPLTPIHIFLFRISLDGRVLSSLVVQMAVMAAVPLMDVELARGAIGLQESFTLLIINVMLASLVG